MSDLQRLLDEVYEYQRTAADGAAGDGTEQPEWSSDEALDEVFAGWVPGPSADASNAERTIFEPDDSLVNDPFEGLLPDVDAPDPTEALLAMVGDEPLDLDDTDILVADDDVEVAPVVAAAVDFDVEPALVALVEPTPMPVDLTDVEPAEPVATRAWCRSDDDILPSHGRRRLSLSFRR